MNGFAMKARMTAAVAGLVLALSGATSQAAQPTLRLIGNPLPPPAAAMANAKPLTLPRPTPAQMKAMGLLKADGSFAGPATRTTQALSQTPKILSAGNVGGPVQTTMETVPVPKALSTSGSSASGASPLISLQNDTPTTFNFGTDLQWPFTTSRVELNGKLVNSKLYPYRASGVLVVNFGNGLLGLCSASLIARGVLITAAHCVAQYGVGYYNASFTFYPGFYNGKAPYGSAYAVAVGALPAFIAGNDGCAADGIACLDDVAVIVLKGKKGKYIGNKTGWLGVAVDGAGFNSTGMTQITQLGYPSGIDYGGQMQRNDSMGQAQDATVAFNTVIGTPMNEGSSGGPWVVNFGAPGYPNGVYPGLYSAPDMVVGVTSWGYVNSTQLIAASSPLTSGNIGSLLAAACAYDPGACAQ